MHYSPKGEKMRTAFGKESMGFLAGIVFATILTSAASAQCVDLNALKAKGQLQKQSWEGYDSFRSGRLIRASANEDAVVGFWRVILTARGNVGIPDGAVLDQAFAQWHDDGTEIMASSRPPSTGNTCLGTWKKVSPLHYVLNHFGISWDSGNFIGLANIREEIDLSRDGSSFTGTFTIDQYDPSKRNPVHIQGEIAGQRIDVNTTVNDLM
jgi:hypothetical protein